ncbi:alpha/beta-hydrolase [Marasmius fiardii PR-910]|nr:alpha/beta-hydrolase [Marasmius fiardii PR-910]
MSSPITLTYKIVKDVPIKLDAYLPTNSQTQGSLPAVVYFHGGGLVMGSRSDLFPTWLQNRVTSAGYVFISADFRLIPTGPTTGHDVIKDIKDLFSFLRSGETLGNQFRLDPAKIAVAGSSAGGLCAYLATIHVSPKPVALLSIFASGGDFLTPFYLNAKSEPFLRGRPLVDESKFTDFIHPLGSGISNNILSESPLTFVPGSNPPIPANPRMAVAFLYLQLGTYLDYYTGECDPSISRSLRNLLSNGDSKQSLIDAISEKHRALFPQLNVSGSWPPTYLLHGGDDTAVLVQESENIHQLLKDAGVESTLKIVPGQDHYFESMIPNGEELFANIFDEVANFLETHLGA